MTGSDDKDWRSFNLNNYVRIKLKPEGLRILKEQHDELYSVITARGGKRREFEPPTADADGWVKMQLWCLMQDFGPYIRLGAEAPFETEIQFSSPLSAIGAMLPPAPDRCPVCGWVMHDEQDNAAPQDSSGPGQVPAGKMDRSVNANHGPAVAAPVAMGGQHMVIGGVTNQVVKDSFNTARESAPVSHDADTPRTDALFGKLTGEPRGVALAMTEHARQLERELAEAQKIQIHAHVVQAPDGSQVSAPCAISGCQYSARSARGDTK